MIPFIDCGLGWEVGGGPSRPVNEWEGKFGLIKVCRGFCNNQTLTELRQLPH